MEIKGVCLYEDETGKAVHEMKNLIALMESSFQLIERDHPQVKGFRFWSDTKADMDELLRLTNVISGERRRHAEIHAGEELMAMIDATVEMFRVRCAEGGLRVTYSSDGIVSVPVAERGFDVMEIKRSLINLMKNAMEACRVGDEIDIEIRERMIGERRYLIIGVSDTGKEVPAGMKTQIFDENFTTKQKGSGKGLAVVKECAMAHGGYVTLESDEERTTFEVYIPLA